uniref:Uncharacterized protein n=1 Tax=Romanomermis culicivorax TaxID=13658 RepID=A0A915L9G3_ROMCU
MGSVHSVYDTELLGPQARHPSQDECGDVIQQSVCCANVNGHGDANTKAAEEVDQNHLVQRTRDEKLKGWVDTWWMEEHQQRNTMR